jgi:hypothetical protein
MTHSGVQKESWENTSGSRKARSSPSAPNEGKDGRGVECLLVFQFPGSGLTLRLAQLLGRDRTTGLSNINRYKRRRTLQSRTSTQIDVGGTREDVYF